MAHDLFISYSTKDKAVADAVCARFESGGIRCWYAPRDIEPGADWAESIIQAIDGSRVLALIFTKDSNVSRQVLREVTYAVGKGVTILPLRLTKDVPIERMQYFLSAVHWIDALDTELEESIEEFYKTAKAVLNTKPVEVVPTEIADKAEALPSGNTAKNRKRSFTIGILAAVIVAAVAIGLFLSKTGKREAGMSVQSTAMTDSQNETAAAEPGTSGKNAGETLSDTGKTLPDTNEVSSDTDKTQQDIGADIGPGLMQDTSGDDEKKPSAGIADFGTDADDNADDAAASVGQPAANPNLEGKTTKIMDGNPDALCGSLSKNAGKKLDTSITGSAVSGFSIGGNMAYDDGWYYFRSSDSEKLYKMREDGSEVKKISDRSVKYITVDHGYVYFMCESGHSGIYRVDLNGENEAFLFGRTVTLYFIRSNVLYAVDYDEVYALDLSLVGDGYDVDIPNDELLIGTFPNDIYPSSCCVDDEYIYYSYYDEGLWRARFDGSEIVQLREGSINYVTIAGGCLYFMEFLSETNNEGMHLSSYDLETDTYNAFSSALYCTEQNVTGDGIWYSGNQGNLSFFDPTTGEETVYTDYPVTDVNVAGNKLYYYDFRDYCVINLDGSGKILL